MVYQKTCAEENPYYSVFYGCGTYNANAEGHALHYDSAFTVSYFKHTCGTLKVEGKKYAIHSGDAVIIHPREIHLCDIPQDSFHERISLYINPALSSAFPFADISLFRAFTERTAAENNVIPSYLVAKLGIDRLLEEILSLAQKNRALCLCKIVTLLSALASAILQEQPTAKEENATVNAVIRYISEHLTEDISCEKIAELFFISKFRLEHLFKESAGISLWEYVILKRLIFCNELLKKGYSVKEASLEAGFRNYSNFYRLYKKHLSITPQAFKQRYAAPV